MSFDVLNQLIGAGIEKQHHFIIFRSNGTWTVPAGVTNVFITACGGGAGSRAISQAYGGAGAAAMVRSNYVVTPNTSLLITIGLGSTAYNIEGGTTTVTGLAIGQSISLQGALGNNGAGFGSSDGNGATGILGAGGGSRGGGGCLGGGGGGYYGPSNGGIGGALYYAGNLIIKFADGVNGTTSNGGTGGEGAGGGTSISTGTPGNGGNGIVVIEWFE